MVEMTVDIVVRIPPSDGWTGVEEKHTFVFPVPDNLRISERTVQHFADDFASDAGAALTNMMQRHLQIGNG